MDYPDWVPSYVKKEDFKYFRERSGLKVSDEEIELSSDPLESRIINVLASDERMEEVWGSICSAAKNRDIENIIRKIVKAIIMGVSGPTSYWETVSKGERNKEINKLENSIKTCTYLMKKMGIDKIDFNLHNASLYSGSHGGIPCLEYENTELITVLDEFKDRLQPLKEAQGYLRKIPSDPESARETYFVRRMHHCFETEFKRPLETAIGMLATIFLEAELDRND